MTENEKIIEEANEIAKGRMYATNEVIRLQKELEQYRAIGTVEEFKAYKLGDCMNDCEHYENCSNYIYSKGYNKDIDDLCNEFHKDWEEQCENDMEDCINWYDWLIASAKQLKGGAE